MENSFLIVGLGNPGKKYEFTRHNAGFLIIDQLQKEFFPDLNWKEKYKGLCIETYWIINNKKIQCFLLKPQTFMNLSGVSVCECIQKEKIHIKNTIVIHDEIELPSGVVKLKEGGGHRGHNGLRNIIERCGNDFVRIRIGVGRPISSITVADYLLSEFTPSEKQKLPKIYEEVKKILIPFLEFNKRIDDT